MIISKTRLAYFVWRFRAQIAHIPYSAKRSSGGKV